CLLLRLFGQLTPHTPLSFPTRRSSDLRSLECTPEGDDREEQWRGPTAYPRDVIDAEVVTDERRDHREVRDRHQSEDGVRRGARAPAERRVACAHPHDPCDQAIDRQCKGRPDRERSDQPKQVTPSC